MNTYKSMIQYVAEIFLEWKMSHNIFMAKQDPRLTFSKFAPKIVLFFT